MEDLISNASLLYENDAGHSSPPLPPTPAGEPVPHVSYGSRSTKITSVPPLEPLPPQDFTPRLPARPNNSIHPSARGNPGSPTKARAASEKALPQTHLTAQEEETPPPSPAKTFTTLETTPNADERNSIYFPAQDSPTRSLEEMVQTSTSANDSTSVLIDTPRP